MNFLSNLRTIGVILISATALLGCQNRADNEMRATQPMSTEVTMPDLPDTTGEAVWSYLADVDYAENWVLWPEKGELYTGQEPHGMLLTTYLNEAAAEAVGTHAGSMPDGSIIVKENYKPDSTLAAITVMYKVQGFNPDHSDWFFSKHQPDGSLATGPNGMMLEGRVPGCQSCHSEQKSNDYIFTGSLSASN